MACQSAQAEAKAVILLLTDAAQARAVMAKAWPKVTEALSAGKRLQLVITRQKRSSEANARMWAMLGEVAAQVEWHGMRLSKEDWKAMFTASLKKQRAVPGIDGGFVVLGSSTSDMTREEISDLMALIEAFGAQHGVRFAAQQREMA